MKQQSQLNKDDDGYTLGEQMLNMMDDEAVEEYKNGTATSLYE